MQEGKHKEKLKEIVAAFTERHTGTADQLLPLLHRIQTQCGAVPSEAVAMVAEALNIAPAEVAGVISFYADFHAGEAPPADQLCVDVCCAEACQAVGADDLYAELTDTHGVSARTVSCLGNCAAGPSVRVGSAIVGRADINSVQRLKAASPPSGN